MVTATKELADYVPPIWLNKKGKQQACAHVDFCSDDYSKNLKKALSLGAKLADYQSEGWTVLIDPEGHPFCLYSSNMK